MDSLPGFAPQYELDAGRCMLPEPSLAMQEDGDHRATLTENSPSPEHLGIYNVMLTRERTLQVRAQPLPCQLMWLRIPYICRGDWYRRIEIMLTWVHEGPD